LTEQNTQPAKRVHRQCIILCEISGQGVPQRNYTLVQLPSYPPKPVQGRRQPELKIRTAALSKPENRCMEVGVLRRESVSPCLRARSYIASHGSLRRDE